MKIAAAHYVQENFCHVGFIYVHSRAVTKSNISTNMANVSKGKTDVVMTLLTALIRGPENTNAQEMMFEPYIATQKL